MLNRYRAFQSEGLANLIARSQLLETPFGAMEFAVQGQGVPLLVAHGSMGGYDQGLTALYFLPETGVKRIVPSRFGYLRTPLLADPSAASQVAAFAALLDALQLEKSWVVGLSSGGMSALQFAMQYPRRCRGLIMISAISTRISQPAVLPWLVRHVLTKDFLGWYLATHHPRLVVRSTGDDYTRVEGDPLLKNAFRSLAWPAHSALRRTGMLNDIEQANRLPADPVSPLSIPLLVIHGTVDPFVPFASAQKLLIANPQANQLIFKDGGHLSFLLKPEQTTTAILNFMGLLPHA